MAAEESIDSPASRVQSSSSSSGMFASDTPRSGSAVPRNCAPLSRARRPSDRPLRTARAQRHGHGAAAKCPPRQYAHRYTSRASRWLTQLSRVERRRPLPAGEVGERREALLPERPCRAAASGKPPALADPHEPLCQAVAAGAARAVHAWPRRTARTGLGCLLPRSGCTTCGSRMRERHAVGDACSARSTGWRTHGPRRAWTARWPAPAYERAEQHRPTGVDVAAGPSMTRS